MAVAGLLASCAREKAPWRQPLTLVHVPTIRVRLTAQALQTATLASTAGYRLWVDGKPVSQSAGALPSATVRHSGGRWSFNALSVEGTEAMLEPLGGFLRVGKTSYRGRLRLLAAGDQFTIINDVDLESYLAGVLSEELYPTWSPATYQALAVAARTFALYQMKTAGAGRDFDLGDDQASQVYGGASAEMDKSWRAVRATHGQVLTYGPAGQEQIFLAQYSACCGGVVNGASVIHQSPDIPPLAGGQRCDDCRQCPKYRWGPVSIPKAEVYRAAAQAYPAVANLGGLATIKVTAATPYDRPVWLDLVGSDGRSVRLRAEDLRLALLRSGLPAAKQLYSMNCRIEDAGRTIEFADGKGFGHGVGLCQWGAQGKADRGWRAEEILWFYYPESRIQAAY
jgi:stage II sporulation protein D